MFFEFEDIIIMVVIECKTKEECRMGKSVKQCESGVVVVVDMWRYAKCGIACCVSVDRLDNHSARGCGNS